MKTFLSISGIRKKEIKKEINITNLLFFLNRQTEDNWWSSYPIIIVSERTDLTFPWALGYSSTAHLGCLTTFCTQKGPDLLPLPFFSACLFTCLPTAALAQIVVLFWNLHRTDLFCQPSRKVLALIRFKLLYWGGPISTELSVRGILSGVTNC